MCQFTLLAVERLKVLKARWWLLEKRDLLAWRMRAATLRLISRSFVSALTRLDASSRIPIISDDALCFHFLCREHAMEETK